MYGSLVRRVRDARGLTQVQLAEISGIEQSNISAIENDRRAPTAETLLRLLAGCGFAVFAEGGRDIFAVPLPDEVPLADGGATPVDVPMSTRVRMVAAALDAAEATVRSR